MPGGMVGPGSMARMKQKPATTLRRQKLLATKQRLLAGNAEAARAGVVQAGLGGHPKLYSPIALKPCNPLAPRIL